MNAGAHWLKRRVIARPWLRRLLRERVLAPLQRRELRRVVRALPVAAPDTQAAPTVLVLAFRHWAISRAWETVVTRLLLAEGCRVVWLECDRALVRCDGMAEPEPDRRLCEHCCAWNRAAAAIAGVERLSLRSFAEDAARDVAPGDLEALVAPSFQRLRAAGRRDASELSADERRMRDDLLASAATARGAAARVLERVRPDAILALNGKLFAEAAFLAEAARRGIAAWTYERGNRRDTIALARGRPAIPFDARAIVAGLRERPLAPRERETIDAYLRARADLGNGQVRFAPRGRLAPVPARAPGRRTLALFTNLIWDSGVVGEDTIFADMFDWLETTLAAVAGEPGVDLVVRVHPAEEKVYWHPTRERVEDRLAQRPGGLPANVRLVRPSDPVDSYALVRDADLVLVYASTIGAEAAALGKRVVVAANSSYAAAPFVVRPQDRAAYLAELASGVVAPPAPDAAELATRFMYRLYFEEMLPVPGVAEDATGFHARPVGEGDADPLRGRLRAWLADLAPAHGRAS